jgi:hypothetical protein
VEIMLRCAVPDRPGALAELAGVIGATGADIESVEVVDVEEGTALDDLVLRVRDPGHLKEMLVSVKQVAGVEVVHAAVSRGHPGDAVTRFAVGIEALINGAMPPDRAIVTLLGGLLRAEEVAVMDDTHAPIPRARVMVLPMGERLVVVRRPYPFSPTEHERAKALIRACVAAQVASGTGDRELRTPAT